MTQPNSFAASVGRLTRRGVETGVLRPLRLYQYIVDTAIAVLFLLWMSSAFTSAGALPLTMIGMTLAVLLRRAAPVVALGVAWLTVIVQLALLGEAPVQANFAVFAVLYACARYGRRWVRNAGLISVIIGAAVAALDLLIRGKAQLRLNPQFTLGSGFANGAVTFLLYLVVLLIVLGVWWLLGWILFSRETVRQSRVAEQLALADATMARREMFIAQERNEIAREMHDIIAHSLTVVISQSDGATFALKKNPDAVAGALATIGSTARTALGDVALLLEQLRHSESTGPQPGIAELDALFAQMRTAGLDLRLEFSGVQLQLGAPQQLAVYRILQEALTNALRHGEPATPVTVAIRWSTDEVELIAENVSARRPDPAAFHGGHGVTGMSERAGLVAGFVESGAVGNSFRVRAVIPASVTPDSLPVPPPKGSS
jgi:signal transduction histidine kinase